MAHAHAYTRASVGIVRQFLMRGVGTEPEEETHPNSLMASTAEDRERERERRKQEKEEERETKKE